MVLGNKDRSPKERIALETQVLNESNRIVATSPPMKEEMVKYYGTSAKKIVIIPGGVNLNRFTPTTQLLARRVLHLHPNRQIILYVGRIERRKGLDTLLSALYELAQKIPDQRKVLRLYISGSVPPAKWATLEDLREKEELYRLDAIVEQLKIRDMVRFIGSVNREYLQYYYSSADVTVVPSFYEPFGLVPLESMACGTLVIASKVGGMQWTIKDGKTGILVPPQDPVTLAEKIYYVLTHPAVRKKMRENGIDRMKRFFSWDSVAEQMSDFYDDFLLDYYYHKGLAPQRS
jgi:glycosyltransferase involved in cell wall biosynthesis